MRKQAAFQVEESIDMSLYASHKKCPR